VPFGGDIVAALEDSEALGARWLGQRVLLRSAIVRIVRRPCVAVRDSTFAALPAGSPIRVSPWAILPHALMRVSGRSGAPDRGE